MIIKSKILTFGLLMLGVTAIHNSYGTTFRFCNQGTENANLKIDFTCHVGRQSAAISIAPGQSKDVKPDKYGCKIAGHGKGIEINGKPIREYNHVHWSSPFKRAATIVLKNDKSLVSLHWKSNWRATEHYGISSCTTSKK